MTNLLNFKYSIGLILTAGLAFLMKRKDNSVQVEDCLTIYQIIASTGVYEWIDPSNCSWDLVEPARRIKEEAIQQLMKENKVARAILDNTKIEIRCKIGNPFPENMEDVVIAVNQKVRLLYPSPDTMDGTVELVRNNKKLDQM